MGKIMKCPSCGAYTLKIKCPKCKVNTKEVGPAKFSPQDKWGKWRRAAKKQIEEKG